VKSLCHCPVKENDRHRPSDTTRRQWKSRPQIHPPASPRSRPASLRAIRGDRLLMGGIADASPSGAHSALPSTPSSRPSPGRLRLDGQHLRDPSRSAVSGSNPFDGHMAPDLPMTQVPREDPCPRHPAGPSSGSRAPRAPPWAACPCPRASPCRQASGGREPLRGEGSPLAGRDAVHAFRDVPVGMAGDDPPDGAARRNHRQSTSDP
jgi:hypothetical protein